MAVQSGRVNFPAKIPPLLGALLLALLLGACSPNVPTAKRGAIDFYRDGQMTSSRVMTEPEARAVSAWFQSHGSGWSRSQVSDAPATLIRLRHSDRETTMINLFGNTVVVTSSGGQFRRTLSPQETADLRALAGIGP